MTKSVIVIGELNVDAILSGPEVRPEPNKEKLIEHFEITLGSSSAITACRLAQLGLSVYFISIIGNDQFGNYCIERLNHFGVNTEHVVRSDDEKTGVTFSLSTPQDRSLLTYMGSISKVNPTMIPEELFQKAVHVHFGSYFLQDAMRDHWKSLFQKAKEFGLTTSFDAGWDPKELWYREQINSLLPYTNFFIPSETEIEHIYGVNDLNELPASLPKERGNVVVKRGKQGASLLTANNEWIHAEGFSVNALDTTGAGDSFNAGLLYAFLSGKTGMEMLAVANACGAISTLSVGGTGGAFSPELVATMINKGILE